MSDMRMALDLLCLIIVGVGASDYTERLVTYLKKRQKERDA